MTKCPSATEKVNQAIKLQDEALACVEQAKRLLAESDEIIADLGLNFSLTQVFLCDGEPYRVNYKAIGFMPGNRYWISHDKDMKIIR